MPTLSVDAGHVSQAWEEDTLTGVGMPGAAGEASAWVVVVAVLLGWETIPTELVAVTL